MYKKLLLKIMLSFSLFVGFIGIGTAEVLRDKLINGKDISILNPITIVQQQVSGKVIDQNGLPLAGVNIIEKGTSNGVTTDFNGKYSIDVADDATLVYSYVGFSTIEQKVAGRSTIDVKLSEGLELDEFIIVGSRSKRRTATDTPVPVDILDVADIASNTGKSEITEILQYAAPSFNASKQTGSDGADHIVPASLRGLGPDQTLVLINGKRRHQSSLVNVFGTRGRGNSGTDLNAIPSSAIKRVEVLRDGASAQYGSDAIAGVINIVLNDNTGGFSGGVTYGVYSTAIEEDWTDEIKKSGETFWNVGSKDRFDGKDKKFDGETIKIDANYGIAIGNNGGYINFTTEFLSKDNTLRPGFSWRKGYGSAGIDGFNFMVNSAVPINDKTEIYAFGGRSFRDTDANAYSRDAYKEGVTVEDDGDNRGVPSLYPNGFTPRITSLITDVSVSAGVRHEMDNGWNLDFNNTYGKNNFHYYLKSASHIFG